jgi:hypothetical protein
MKLFLRFGAALLALALLAGVIYLGVLSGGNPKFVVWFGIASAIAAPVGLSLLGYVLSRSDADLIQRLAKVPEIERLVAEAKTHEDKVRVLEAEQARLVEIIRIESRRQATLDRIESLERDGLRIIDELDNLYEERRVLEVAAGKSLVNEEIERLRERVRVRDRGDVVFRLGRRAYHIDRDIIKALPFGSGALLLAYFRVVERFQRSIDARHRGRDAPATQVLPSDVPPT